MNKRCFRFILVILAGGVIIGIFGPALGITYPNMVVGAAFTFLAMFTGASIERLVTKIGH